MSTKAHQRYLASNSVNRRFGVAFLTSLNEPHSFFEQDRSDVKFSCPSKALRQGRAYEGLGKIIAARRFHHKVLCDRRVVGDARGLRQRRGNERSRQI